MYFIIKNHFFKYTLKNINYFQTKIPLLFGSIGSSNMKYSFITIQYVGENINKIIPHNFNFQQILVIQGNQNNKHIMTHLAVKSLAICCIYGIMSIFQTLNSRYLYRNLHFDFYSFTFGIQRLVIIAIFFSQGRKHMNKMMMLKIVPYSMFMCLSNILSSYCLTIMPLAAFLSFKKFIVLFILIISVTLKLPVRTNHFQNICIVGIVIGGALVGGKDILHGNIVGYLCCLLFNCSQAMVLQYSAYLYRHDSLEPSQLLLYNCMLGFPYYLGVITYEAEFDDIFFYFRDQFTFIFMFVIIFSIFLACCSELSSSYITMKISPFQKSTVSNIKDLILMLISVFFFNDFHLTLISGFGIILCLISSVLFSLPYLEQKDQQVLPILNSPKLKGTQQGTSLLDDRHVIKHQDSHEELKNDVKQTILIDNETINSQKENLIH